MRDDHEYSHNGTAPPGVPTGMLPGPKEGRSPQSESTEDRTTSGRDVDDMSEASIAHITGHAVLEWGSVQYEGQVLNGVKHGHGTLRWADRREFVGDFHDGFFHGHGRMQWPDGRVFLGQYVKNSKHGHGVFTWPDGREYAGQWYDGKRHGMGRYTNAKQECRIGHWVDDKPISWEREEGVAPSPVTPRTVATAAGDVVV
jgi:hypothetical protein